jgi:hypothetical protein
LRAEVEYIPKLDYYDHEEMVKEAYEHSDLIKKLPEE